MTVAEIKAAIRERDGMKCVKCGMTNDDHIIQFGGLLEVHRIAPGGRYVPENCKTLCKTCHGPMPKSKFRSRTSQIRRLLGDDLADKFLSLCERHWVSPPRMLQWAVGHWLEETKDLPTVEEQIAANIKAKLTKLRRK